MNAQTVRGLRDLADEDSFAAFKSAALACGLTQEEAERAFASDDAVFADIVDGAVLDVRESGAELRDGENWLFCSRSVRVER